MSQYLPLLLELSEIPPFAHPNLVELLTSTKTKIFTNEGLKATLNGTVFSGHPTRTTLFNTVRVLLYNQFACHKLGIYDYSLFVSGDDVFGIIP